MHSDVGGGYPDESLSYVSLLWMMEEAEEAGLRTLKVIKDRFVALASSAGPIHDSRKGMAAYYRYQPRKIAAWLHPVDERTLGLRDPAIAGADGKPQGLLRSVKVHESVIARIACGTDRYAPITLPETFEIVPPQAEGENVPQADSDAGGHGRGRAARDQPASAPPARPLVSNDLRARLARSDVRQARAKAFEAVYDLVWKRRVTYFVTLGFTLALAMLPFWVAQAPEPLWLGDGRTWIDAPLRAIGALVPSMFAYWVNTFAEQPFYFLVLGICIWFGMSYGTRCERRLRDRARHIWHDATNIEGVVPSRARTGSASRRSATRFRLPARRSSGSSGRVLPDLVLLPVIAVTALWLAAAGVTQTALPWLESGTALCPSAGSSLPELVSHQATFRSDDTCHPVGATGGQGAPVSRRAARGAAVVRRQPRHEPAGPAGPRHGRGRHPRRAVPPRHRGQLPAARSSRSASRRAAGAFDSVHMFAPPLAAAGARPLRGGVHGRCTTASCSCSPTTRSRCTTRRTSTGRSPA